MVRQGKTYAKGQTTVASNANKDAARSIARRGRTYSSKGATGGGLAARTGRGKTRRV